MHTLSSTTTELTHSDKALQQEIDQHKDKVQQQKSEKESAERQIADEQDSLASFERIRSAAQTARGKLEAEKQRHKEVIEYRQRLVRDLSVKHNIPGFDHSLAPAEMDDFVDRLEQAIVAQSIKIDQMKVSLPVPIKAWSSWLTGFELLAGCWAASARRTASQDHRDQDLPGSRRKGQTRPR